MKMIIAILLLTLSLTLHTHASVIPVTIDNGSSASGERVLEKSGLSKADVPSVSSITLLATLMPNTNSASWPTLLDRDYAKIKLGVYPEGTMTSPSDPRFIPFKIIPEHFMLSTTVKSWMGNLSPVAPFANENGNTVWFLAIITGDSITLDSVRCTITSSDGANNSLGKTESFAGLSYSAGTRGYLADGTEIVSGPGTQVVKKIILGVASKAYSANTQSAVDTVKTYIGGFTNFNITGTFSVVSGSTTIASASKVLDTVTEPTSPSLSVVPNGGGVNLSLADAEQKRTYLIQSTTDLSTLIWKNEGFISIGAAQTYSADSSSPQKFFRIRLQ